MYLRNYLRQFVRDVRAQKLRLFLTLFGIIWGTAAVTLLLAFGQGLHKKIQVSQKGLGDAIVIAWPSRTSKPWQGLPRGRSIQLAKEDIEIIRREVPEINRISDEYSRDGPRMRYGKKALSVDLSGVNAEFGVMRNMIPESGRFIDDRDLAERRRVVFLGDQLKKDLMGEATEAVGETVELDGAPYVVVGRR